MKHLAAQKKQPTHRFPERTIRIGSLITQDAYTLNGALLLPAGSKVDNPRMLRRLQKPDVRFGPEKSSEIPLDLQVESELDEKEHSKHITMCDLRERMQHAYALKQEVVKDLSSVFGRVSSDGTVDIPTVQSAVSTLLDETITDQSAMLSMVRLKDKDSYTFTHSVNVCILAIFLAIHSNHQERIDEIAMGALVHDIGKVRTPHFVLQKKRAVESARVAYYEAAPCGWHAASV